MDVATGIGFFVFGSVVSVVVLYILLKVRQNEDEKKDKTVA